MTFVTRLGALALLVLCVASSAGAQQQSTRLQPTQLDANFAIAVSADSHRVALGAPQADGRLGAVYVFQKDAGGTWRQAARLTASPQLAGQQFGYAVSIDGDELVVASRFGGADAGGTAVEGGIYRFAVENGQWTQQEKISIGGDNRTAYGAVDLIEGTRLAFTAPFENTRAVYVYEPSDAGAWTEAARLDPPSTLGRAGFSDAVAISEDRLVVGALAFENDGGAFTYRLDDGAWAMTAILRTSGASDPIFRERTVASSGGSSARFGEAVAMDGDVIVVGAPTVYDNDASRFTGAAYLFEASGGETGPPWSLTTQLLPDEAPDADARFGGAVAVEGTRAVVGAVNDDAASGTARGRAYVFNGGQAAWAPAERLRFPFGAVGGFGTSVALADGQPVVGSRQDGSAFVFTVGDPVASEFGPEADLHLSGPVPNPALGRTALNLAVDAPQHVRATLVDALGRTVRTLLDRAVATEAMLAIEAGDLAPGLYVVRVIGERFAAHQTLTVVR